MYVGGCKTLYWWRGYVMCRAQPTLHQCVVMGVGRVQELCGKHAIGEI